MAFDRGDTGNDGQAQRAAATGATTAPGRRVVLTAIQALGLDAVALAPLTQSGSSRSRTACRHWVKRGGHRLRQ